MSTITSSNVNPQASRGIFGKVGKGLGIAGTVISPFMVYNDKRKEGASVPSAMASAAFDAAAWGLAPSVMFGKLALDTLPQLGEAAYLIGKHNREQVRGGYSRNFGGGFFDTQHAANMRQAGVYNMNQSKESVAEAMGKQSRSYYTYNLRRERQFYPQADSRRNSMGEEARGYYRG